MEALKLLPRKVVCLKRRGSCSCAAVTSVVYNVNSTAAVLDWWYETIN